MNLSDLQNECGRLLGDVNHDRWSLAVLTSRLNIAQQVVQGYSNAIKTSETINLTSSTASYGLNANTMDIIRIYKTLTDGSSRPLIGITREQMDFQFPDWLQWQIGEPAYFMYDATAQQITLAPTPNTSVPSVLVYESRKPADLVNSTDLPFDSNNQMIPYHIALCHWVAAQCFEDDGTNEALVKSRFHRSGDMIKPGQFEQNLGRILAEFDVPEAIPSRVMWRPSGGRLGYNVWPQKSYPFLY